MGFLDNVKDALKGALATQASKDNAAEQARKDDAVVVDRAAGNTTAEAAPEPTPEPTPEDPPREAKFETYTVKSGDSLSEIGSRFGVAYLEIAELNNIENPDLIFPGQVFRIPRN